LPIIDPSNREEFFNILKENFVQMESKWTIDKTKDDMEKSIHGFPRKLIRNTSLDPWLSKKSFIFQVSDGNIAFKLCLETK
jgi:hypothetical protein